MKVRPHLVETGQMVCRRARGYWCISSVDCCLAPLKVFGSPDVNNGIPTRLFSQVAQSSKIRQCVCFVVASSGQQFSVTMRFHLSKLFYVALTPGSCQFVLNQGFVFDSPVVCSLEDVHFI